MALGRVGAAAVAGEPDTRSVWQR